MNGPSHTLSHMKNSTGTLNDRLTQIERIVEYMVSTYCRSTRSSVSVTVQYWIKVLYVLYYIGLLTVPTERAPRSEVRGVTCSCAGGWCRYDRSCIALSHIYFVTFSTRAPIHSWFIIHALRPLLPRALYKQADIHMLTIEDFALRFSNRAVPIAPARALAVGTRDAAEGYFVG